MHPLHDYVAKQLAKIHRDYRLDRDSIIRIFDDRVEIERSEYRRGRGKRDRHVAESGTSKYVERREQPCSPRTSRRSSRA